MAQLLLNADLGENERKLATTIHRSGEELLDIINEILDLTKIEAGRIKLEQTDFDLYEAVASRVEFFATRAAAKGVALSYRIFPNVPRLVCGDPCRLGQVLVNLIGNALKFTDTGKVEIDVAELEHDREKVLLRFDVHDTGIGIAPDARKHIFDPFYQGDSSTTRKYGGTGLGLAITRELTELMGGAIGVESEPGIGSNFWFTARFTRSTLAESYGSATSPLCLMEGSGGASNSFGADEPRTQVAVSESAAKRMSRGVVLVVEDNPVNQEVARGLLESLGCEVDVVSNGRESVEALGRSSYDLIFMDCQMPEMDGYEATKAIRRELLIQTPVIALTAHAMKGELDQCLTVGMNDFLTKPFTLKQLEVVLDKWLPVEVHGIDTKQS